MRQVKPDPEPERPVIEPEPTGPRYTIFSEIRSAFQSNTNYYSEEETNQYMVIEDRRAINTLNIESDYVSPDLDLGEVADQDHIYAFVKKPSLTPEGDPIYSNVNLSKKWRFQADVGENKENLSEFQNQVQDVRENVLESAKSDQATGGEEIEMRSMFSSQSVSDPNISDVSDNEISVYEDVLEKCE
jgi:hypothetical protein